MKKMHASDPHKLGLARRTARASSSVVVQHRSPVQRLADHSPQVQRASALQRLADHSPHAVPIQRKALVSNKLNVAGENHLDSDERRDDERSLATEYAEGLYWEENEFIVDVSPNVTAEADPNILKFLTVLHDVQRWSKSIYDANSETSCVSAAKLRDPTLTALINLARQQYNRGVGVAYPSTSQDPLQAHEVTTRDQLMAQRLGYLQTIANAQQALVAMPDGSLDGQQRATVTQHRTAMKTAVEAVVGMTMAKPDLDFLRSMAMNRAAVKMVATKGLWKIGNDHVTDILTKLPEDQPQPNYNLLTMAEFDEFVEQKVSKL